MVLCTEAFRQYQGRHGTEVVKVSEVELRSSPWEQDSTLFHFSGILFIILVTDQVPSTTLVNHHRCSFQGKFHI